MGLFGDLIKNAVGKVVEKAVAPAVDKIADEAESLFGDSLNTAAAAQTETAEAVTETEAAAEAQTESAASAVSQAVSEFAEEMTQTAAKAIWNGPLKNYPAWDYTPIMETNSDDTDEYVLFSIFMTGTDAQIDKYYAKLRANGFMGSWQIMRKMIDGCEHNVDFTFLHEEDGVLQINYVTYK